MRYGLRTLLASQPDMVCVGEAEDGARAIELCRQLHPDVVLMDIVMPRIDGPAAIAAIRREMPEIRVIALTTFSDVGPAQQALVAGAVSYLLKNIPAEELANAVRAAHAGRRTFAPEITEQPGTFCEGTCTYTISRRGKMSRNSKQLVLAFFDNEAAADSAVEALKGWDKATDSIKLGAIGILVKDEKGKIKQQKPILDGTWFPPEIRAVSPCTFQP